MKLILLMAATADGMIAKDSLHPVDWSGKADKKYFVRTTRQAGVVIMGSNTWDTIGKPLPGRENIVMTRDKTRKSNDKDLIFTDRSPARILEDLNARGFESAALIGGAKINSLFMKENLIDEIHLTLVPRLFGRGLTLFSEALDHRLELLDVVKIEGGHLLLKYRVLHN
ncbi:dihydrofolate reductase family protein [Desulfospira joergensenii]|uniref:dihydrofolate reductase family protein n=1 Tax=Desulfospira joergensenii TaxID=53329 RepID=UPI0003B3901E|nr:dihydrofolate reductase family protein [Desulfospira joergensenii]